MKKHVISVVSLVAIVAVMSLLLAITNSITAPIIEKNQNAAANAALLEVMPEGKGFEKVDLSGKKLPATITEAHKETSGKGYVIKLTTTGYGADFVIMCGVSAEGVITGAKCLSSKETKFVEKEYGANFTGKDAAGVEAVDVIAGTTMTTAAYKNAVKDAMNAAIILSGGSAEIRTPEQILQDNLKDALPAGDNFTEWFKTETVEGVDAIYVAENGAGYVCVIGEEFFGVGADGASDNQTVATAIKAVINSKLTAVDYAKSGISKNITAVQKTATGNYVIDIDGLGYAYYDDGHGYYEQRKIPIKIRVSLTAKGTIIDCVTVSHQESKNIGDVCGKKEYYSQYDGKTKKTYTEVEAIAGATFTSDGYQEAILACFGAVTILEGGAK